MPKYENILRKRLEEEEKTLSEETKQMIDRMYYEDFKKYQLEVIKRKRITPQRGDVFIIKPQLSDYYFAGVVLFADTQNRVHTWLNDLSVVAIFNDKAKTPDGISFQMDFNNLLINPGFVPKEYWSKGLFYNIGKKVEIPKDLDFGFYNSSSCKYEDVYGNELDHLPQVIGTEGITTGFGIALSVNRRLFINKELLRDPEKIPEKKQKMPGIFSTRKQSPDKTAVTLQLNARVQPLDRGTLYEDVIEKWLKRKRSGKITGSGTMQDANQEITGCMIEMSIKPAKQQEVLAFLQQMPLPKGSFWQTETENVEIGKLEGLALYLNGVDLPQEVYESCDVNDLIEMLEKSLDGKGEFYSYWVGDQETALYFYGDSFEEMQQKISAIVENYPLCQQSRVTKIA